MIFDIDKKTFDFLSALTGVVVVVYLGAWLYAIVTNKALITDFVKDVGPITAMLVGYWARGVK